MVHAKTQKVLGSAPRFEAILEFLGVLARPTPLLRLLDEAPRAIATILEAEVCSLYVIEGGGELVMRGNVGFPRGAIGEVRLAIGEGITGQAIRLMRPIVAELAGEHASYKHFDDLGEENFPVFLVVPIHGRTSAVGAVVVQRRENHYGEAEAELLALLGGLIAASIRTAELLDTVREKQRRTGGGTRKLTLTGRTVVPGRALGAIAAIRRPTQRGSEKLRLQHDGAADVRMLKAAFDVAEKAITALAGRAKQLKLGRSAVFLGTYVEILTDMRFRELVMEIAGKGEGIPNALGRVARDVTRTAAHVGDSFLEERARDVEDLCDALSMLAATDKRVELPQKAVLIGDGLTVFDLLVSARAHPVGVALSERATGPRIRTLLELLDVPAIVDVHGLYRWAADGDVVLIDGDHGLVVINPSKNEVASLREERRQRSEPRMSEE